MINLNLFFNGYFGKNHYNYQEKEIEKKINKKILEKKIRYLNLSDGFRDAYKSYNK